MEKYITIITKHLLSNFHHIAHHYFPFHGRCTHNIHPQRIRPRNRYPEHSFYGHIFYLNPVKPFHRRILVLLFFLFRLAIYFVNYYGYQHVYRCVVHVKWKYFGGTAQFHFKKLQGFQSGCKDSENHEDIQTC